jgi:hypothetical protein
MAIQNSIDSLIVVSGELQSALANAKVNCASARKEVRNLRIAYTAVRKAHFACAPAGRLPPHITTLGAMLKRAEETYAYHSRQARYLTAALKQVGRGGIALLLAAGRK